LLVSWCAGGRCGKVGSDEDRGRSRRPGAEGQGWSGIGRVLRGWTVKRSSDIVCGLHHAPGDEEHDFLGLASKPWPMVCQWFGLKTGGDSFLWFGIKTGGDVFL
jgi:hypothetical protein